MSFGSDKEAHAWLLHQAGYIDQEGYQKAVEEIHAPKPPKKSPVARTAPRSAPVASGRTRAASAPRRPKRVPKHQQRGLTGFMAGMQAGKRKPRRRR